MAPVVITLRPLKTTSRLLYPPLLQRRLKSFQHYTEDTIDLKLRITQPEDLGYAVLKAYKTRRIVRLLHKTRHTYRPLYFSDYRLLT